MANRVLSRLVVLVLTADWVLIPATSAFGGDPNAGDVWVDNVGQPPGPGHARWIPTSGRHRAEGKASVVGAVSRDRRERVVDRKFVQIPAES